MQINGKEIVVRQILAEDLNEACLVIYPFLDEFEDLVSDNQSVAGGKLFRLIGKHAQSVIAFCSYMTDLSYEDIAKLPSKDLLELSKEVIRVNQDFFFDDDRRSDKHNRTSQSAVNRKTDSTSLPKWWFEYAISKLVSNGYDLNTVLKMPYGKYRKCQLAIERLENQQLINQAIAFRIAQADEKNFKNWVDELS